MVLVYADVIRMPASCWSLDGTALVLVARRIEGEGRFQIELNYRISQTARLVVYAGELAGSLQARVLTDGAGEELLPIEIRRGAGVAITFQDGKPAQVDQDRLQPPMLAAGSDYHRLLRLSRGDLAL